MSSEFVLVGAFLSGFFSLLITLVEIWVLNYFIRKNQGNDLVPTLVNESDHFRNEKIRGFRSLLFSKRAQGVSNLLNVRRIVILLNSLAYLGYALFCLGVGYLFFTH